MEIYVRPAVLTYRRPFGISRWTRTETHNVFVEVHHEGIVGYGEGAPNARYGESQEQAIAKLTTLPGHPFHSPLQWLEIHACLRAHFSGARAAEAALDMALHDWAGKYEGRPLFQLWGMHTNCTIPTSYTIGLSAPEEMARLAAEVAGSFRVLKVKLGTRQDYAIIEAIRAVTDVPLRVDANEGWSDVRQALEMIHWLAGQGVELVEQPLPAGRWEEMAWLKEHSPLPLIADEDAHEPIPWDRLVRAYHGINIKLDKCGGLTRARYLVGSARARGLRIMLGCMVASSLSITAAAHLSGYADYADLDGHLLLASDPYEGLRLEEGRLCLPERPGIGVVPRS